MIKVSYFLHILVLLLCLVGCWVIFSNQSQADFLSKEISKISLEIKELTTAVEEAKKGQQDKLAREKRKNIELEEQEETFIKDIADL
jgi:Tfp pilus assembly protein PilN